MSGPKSMSGFVYIWYDRKHKRFYIGSHWGSPDDGYVCSSSWMKQAYKKRPEDFKRRILSIVTESRKDLFVEEHKWLSLIRHEEIGVRYYNLTKAANHHWAGDPEKVRSTAEKISESKKGQVVSEETRKKLSIAGKGRKHTDEARQKMSEGRKGMTFTDDHKENLSKAKQGKDTWMKGRQHTDEAKQKLREKHLGMKPTIETLEKRSKSLKGMKWYTDGVQDCRIHDGDPVPDGFVRGRSKGLENLSMMAEKWNDPAYREHMSNVHRKRCNLDL